VAIQKDAGIEAIVKAMQQHVSNAAVQKYACWALRKLA